ncbi:major facilitator superfamily domain-containing protein [Protomyces lactucae-debilis]|uniref:Probable transporter MCH1 n=1 Tax=Protomyces lactucae-debilis TaxID=2754530 RepID=A0A1Y2FAN7_PROLT|nr:major facilitator superfamily domain-containing protein [Protomyces lactucae-debilis]ORY80982.1 major facilitator superfamily domain-containing protein [Protomyces lactucae-debilis]
MRGPQRIVVKWTSFACALLNCLVAGSVVTFALYAPQLQRHLHYTSIQVNTVGIACQLGLYLTVPVLGILCDSKGPRIVSAYAAALALPAYLIAGKAYKHAWPPAVLVTCFAILGSATVALYLSGISTVAKNHPRSRGLAMAVVTASFGLSGLWETQVVDHFFRDKHGEINIEGTFLMFGLLLSITAVISSFGLRIVAQETFEEEDMSDASSVDEATALLAQSGVLEPSEKLSLKDKIRIFLKDHSSWWFFLAFVLLAGPGEVYTNNLGILYTALKDQETQSVSASVQVSLFALSSTFGRLFFGALCDIPSQSPITLRMTILIVAAMVLSLGFSILAWTDITTDTFWLASVATGLGYGGLFCIWPAVSSLIWGLENFATYWGCLATAPAVGSVLFGLLYASIYDKAAQEQHNSSGLCTGHVCFSRSTGYFAISNLLGVCILIFALRVWRRRFPAA